MKIIRTQPQGQHKLPRLVARAESGQAIVILVLAMVALVGFTALAIDGGNAFYVRRNMQNAADGGVVAGVQGFLDTYDGTNAEIEEAIVLAAQAEAESNSVEDPDATAANCVNGNVSIWYINELGNVLDVSTGAVIGSGQAPVLGDGYDIQSVRLNTTCASLGSAPAFNGIQVITLQEFDTFLAGVLGINTLEAQGGAAAIIRFEENGCLGDFAAFGLADPQPSGSLNLSGTSPYYAITGDFYAADHLQITGSGALLIEGDITYVNSIAISSSTDVWIGDLDTILSFGSIAISGNCNNATVPADWTYDNTGISGEVCYQQAEGYSYPQQVSPVAQPFSFDLPGDFGPGSVWADDAAGCDTTDSANCFVSFGSRIVTFGNKDFEWWGNDYYYLDASDTGSPSWSPNGETLPTGLYYLYGNTDVSVNGSLVVDKFLSIVTDGSVGFTGASNVTVNPSTQSWKPYGGFNGSGLLIATDDTSNGAIQMSGATLPDSEGIMYAPLGDCTVSGSQSYSGAFLCQQLNSSGSSGSITFNPAFCPPPGPPSSSSVRTLTHHRQTKSAALNSERRFYPFTLQSPHPTLSQMTHF